MKNTALTPEGWHLCRKPSTHIFKLRQERHLSFLNETTERKSPKPRHSPPHPGAKTGDIFSTKNITVPLRWSSIGRYSACYKGIAPPGLMLCEIYFLGKNEWFGWFWAAGTGSPFPDFCRRGSRSNEKHCPLNTAH